MLTSHSSLGRQAYSAAGGAVRILRRIKNNGNVSKRDLSHPYTPARLTEYRLSEIKTIFPVRVYNTRICSLFKPKERCKLYKQIRIQFQSSTIVKTKNLKIRIRFIDNIIKYSIIVNTRKSSYINALLF